MKDMRLKKLPVTLCIVILIILIYVLASCTDRTNEMKDRVAGLYGENHAVTCAVDRNLAVKCSNGTFVGLMQDEVISYKGIPYAEPPTGELRWKPPIPAKDDDGTYEAYYFGCSPIQTEWVSEPGSYYPQSEDCLTLNVWTNSGNTLRNKPVMVFFHGGSYGWGATSDPIYDGHNLVARYDDIILVSVEFRSGIMGFIDLSSVEGGEEFEESGNLGLLDQKCALEWVRKNIEAFGGDPGNVTIWGESSGAGSVSLLPLIDGTEGLFHRIIAESGSVALTYSREECQNLTEMLLNETGCSGMAELMALSEDEIKAVNEKLNDYNNFPERDGVVLPEDLYEAYNNGETNGIDLLIGTNADEVKYWVWEMGYDVPLAPGDSVYRLFLPIIFENNMRKLSNDEKTRVNTFMTTYDGSKTDRLTELYNEILFRIPAMQQAVYHSGNGNNTYTYYWTYPCADETIGACHAVELAYVFNNPDETIYTGGKYDETLADTVQEMWVNFARTGDPSTDAYRWEPYDFDTRKTMVLGDEVYMESDIKADQRKELEPMLHHYFNGCYSQLSYNVPQVYRIAAVVMAVIILIAAAAFTARRKKNRNGFFKT